MQNRIELPFALFNAAVWGAFLAFYAVLAYLEGSFPGDLLARTTIYAASAFATYASGLATLTFLRRRSVFRVGIAVMFAGAALLTHSLIAACLYDAFLPETGYSFLDLASAAALYGAPIVSLTGLGAATIHILSRLSQERQNALERDNAARRAQLDALRHQMQPHFLFNTLNSISALVVARQNADAERAILMLSSLLRRSLDTDAAAMVPLRDEVAAALNYVDIEKVRYDERFRLKIAIDDDVHDWPVLPFVLQPLLENIVKHAVAVSRSSVQASIEVRERAGKLVIDIEDDGPGLDGGRASAKSNDEVARPRGCGVGLANLRRRLALVYGAEASLSLGGGMRGGTRVRLVVPALARTE